MNIDLMPDLEKYVKDKVANGGYADESAVISHALIRVQAADERYDMLVAELAKAEEQADRGEGVEYTPELGKAILKRAIERVDARRTAEGREIKVRHA